MFRLLWHVLPDNKAIWIALTYVYWIGQSRARQICEKVGVDFETKVKDLKEDDIKKLTDITREYTLENDLRREVASAIKRLKEIKTWRGMRHNLWLPVRGQKTRRNARTAKKLLWRSRVRPVLKK